MFSRLAKESLLKCALPKTSLTRHCAAKHQSSDIDMKNLIGQTCYQAVLFSVVALVAAKGIAQSTTTAQDCAPTDLLAPDLRAPDGSLLTREQKIALLDRVLLESLANGPCQVGENNGTVGSDTAGAGLEGADGVSGAEGASGLENVSGLESASGETAIESVPVGDIQGDGPTSEEAQDADNAAMDDNTALDDLTATNKSTQDNQDATLSNGKAPDDIPPAENDDIIAQQFRQAAIEETDPVAKAKLWNEYRRYKNLPVQDVPET